MKNIYYRLLNAFKIGIWAFRNPETMNAVNFKMISDVLGLIFKVATEARPVMSKIAYIHPDTNEPKEIVALWAGAGLGADPYDRITELKKEIEILKLQLLNNVKSTPQPKSKDNPNDKASD